MGDLSLNFSRVEFLCKGNDCNQDTVDVKLLDVLQWLREYTGSKVTINSGNRCPRYNTQVGGKRSSQHLYSRAADIVVDYYTPETIADILNDQFGNEISIGLYETFVHVDTRTDGGKRWRG